MRQKKNRKKTTGRIPDVLTESELLKYPAKTIFEHYLNEILIGLFTLVTALLLFPLTFRTAACDLAAFLSMFWLTSIVIRRKQKSRSALRFWAVSAAMFLFAAICPYITCPKPLYIANADKMFGSKINTLSSVGRTIGSVMLVSDTDPVRHLLTPFLHRVFPNNIRILEEKECQNGSYYYLPVFRGFIFEMSEQNSMPSRKSIYFPAVCRVWGVSFELLKPQTIGEQLKDNNCELHFGYSFGSLIDFGYVQYPNTIPWEAVQVENRKDSSIVVYTAMLDRAIEFIGTGETEAAVNCLDSAASFVPAQNLEGARLAALRYVMAKLSCRDNVGELQALPLLHSAYELFLKSRNDSRFTKDDPLMNWLHDVLTSGYDDWIWTLSFLDRASVLKGIPHLDEDVLGQNRYTDTLKHRFEWLTYEETLSALKATNYSSADLHYIKYLMFWKFTTAAIADVLSTNMNFDSDLLNVESEGNRLVPLVRYIDSALEQKFGLQPDTFSRLVFATLDCLAKELPKLPENSKDEDAIQFCRARANLNPIFGEMARLIERDDGWWQTNGPAKDGHERWWDADYMTWFFVGAAMRQKKLSATIFRGGLRPQPRLS